MQSCRVCMGDDDVVVDIFTDQPLNELELTLWDMINEIVDFEVQRDKLPRKICRSCSLDAQIAFRFKRSCEHSHYMLKALIGEDGSEDKGVAKTGTSQLKTENQVVNNDKETNSSPYDPNIIVKTEPCSQKAFEGFEFNVINEFVNDAPDWENDFVDDKECNLLQQNPIEFVKTEETSLKSSDDYDSNFNSDAEDSDYEGHNDTDSTVHSSNNSTYVKSNAKNTKRNCLKPGKGKTNFYKCTFCGRTFDHHMTLKKHILSHTKPYKCDLCDKSFIRPKVLKIHRSTHLAAKFKCSKCPRSYLTEHSLQMHTATHASEQKPVALPVQSNLEYKCPHCPRSYSQNSALLRHLEFHSDDHPFKCDLCNIPFANKASLRLHRRKHINDRRYKCSHCPEAFLTRAKLMGHERMHTGERPFQCKICDKNFVTKENRSQHFRRMHKNIDKRD